MASSNRHWPSMFKSKPCNTPHHHHHHHQWQTDINPSLISTGCHRAPYTSVGGGGEERSPEPKPRWNPKPEQIRILEAIFNSGMVNPPRDEIRKIRAQLQEYGQVGDANVFYWFQNRKSRSKHKNHRHQPLKQPKSPAATATSSSSSDKSSPKSSFAADHKTFSLAGGSSSVIDVSNSPTASVNQLTYFQTPPPPPPAEFLPEPFYFPAATTQGFCFQDQLSNYALLPTVTDHQTAGNGSGFLLSELMMINNHNHNHHQHGHPVPKKVVGGDHDDEEEEKLKMQQLMSTYTTQSHSMVPQTSVSGTSTINHNILGAGIGVAESGALGANPAKSTVFINEVAFEVAVGPFNVREAFGDDAVLIHSTGQPVLTNEWGITLQSLQHGGFYYLVRTLTPIPASETQLIW